MAFAQVRASHVNTTLIYCEVETQILRELKLISPDLTLKKRVLLSDESLSHVFSHACCRDHRIFFFILNLFSVSFSHV